MLIRIGISELETWEKKELFKLLRGLWRNILIKKFKCVNGEELKRNEVIPLRRHTHLTWNEVSFS